MFLCKYCGHGGVPEHQYGHTACEAEFARRQKAELCMFCGTKLADSDIAAVSLGHEACYSPNVFSGYPGQ